MQNRIVDPDDLRTLAVMQERYWQILLDKVSGSQFVTEILPNAYTEQERENMILTVECAE